MHCDEYQWMCRQQPAVITRLQLCTNCRERGILSGSLHVQLPGQRLEATEHKSVCVAALPLQASLQ